MISDISEDRPQLKSKVVDQLRDQIAGGLFPLGTRLSDKEIAFEMRVSRTPVREALLQLQNEGLIVVRPRSGTFVFDLSPNELSQICEMRSLFEVGALRMAAAYDVRELIGSLTVHVAQAALALEAKDFAECEMRDTAFHETLIDRSRNKYLVESYRIISSKVRALRSQLPQNEDRVARAISQHRRIIDLIAVKNVDAAAAEITSHVHNVERQLKKRAAPGERPDSEI